MGSRSLKPLLAKRRGCIWCNDPGCFFQRKINAWLNTPLEITPVADQDAQHASRNARNYAKRQALIVRLKYFGKYEEWRANNRRRSQKNRDTLKEQRNGRKKI